MIKLFNLRQPAKQQFLEIMFGDYFIPAICVVLNCFKQLRSTHLAIQLRKKYDTKRRKWQSHVGREKKQIMTILQFIEFIANRSCFAENNTGANYSSELTLKLSSRSTFHQSKKLMQTQMNSNFLISFS